MKEALAARDPPPPASATSASPQVVGGAVGANFAKGIQNLGGHTAAQNRAATANAPPPPQQPPPQPPPPPQQLLDPQAVADARVHAAVAEIEAAADAATAAVDAAAAQAAAEAAAAFAALDWVDMPAGALDGLGGGGGFGGGLGGATPAAAAGGGGGTATAADETAAAEDERRMAEHATRGRRSTIAQLELDMKERAEMHQLGVTEEEEEGEEEDGEEREEEEEEEEEQSSAGGEGDDDAFIEAKEMRSINVLRSRVSFLEQLRSQLCEQLGDGYVADLENQIQSGGGGGQVPAITAARPAHGGAHTHHPSRDVETQYEEDDATLATQLQLDGTEVRASYSLV